MRAEEWNHLPRRQVVTTMTGVMLAMFLAALSQTVVAAAMPEIVAHLGGFDRYAWASASYLIASTVVMPVAGRLSDIYGRKPLFIAGISVFVIASVPMGLSESMTQLIAWRAVQGIGGGMIIVNSFVAIADLFPPEERGKHQGLAGAVYGISALAGPALGGFVTDHFSWNWVFLINVPIGVPVLLLIAATFPKPDPEVENRKLDYPGTAILIMALLSVLIALTSGSAQYGWASGQVVGGLVFGVAMMVVFVIVESRSDAPIMPLDIYRNRVVGVSVMVALLTGFGLYGSILFVPLFFQAVQGVSATHSGAFLTPMMLGVVVGAILSGFLLSRVPGHCRTLAMAGCGVAAVGAFFISTLGKHSGLFWTETYMAIMGLGMGGVLATLNVAVQNSVPVGLTGAATSALMFFRSVGGMLGVAVMGSVMTGRFSTMLEEVVPEVVRAALPPNGLDAARDNPRMLIDPSAAELMAVEFTSTGHDGPQMAEMLLDSLSSALAAAIEGALLIVVAAAALSLGIAYFLELPNDSMSAPPRTNGPDSPP